MLADSAHRDLALAAGFPASGLIEVPEHPEAGPGAAPAVPLAPGDVAFLIHTSGSTGKPKGVMQTHRNVLHNALVRLAGGLGLRQDDRIVLLASPSGGQGISTIWTALLTGATLCPFPTMERGVTGLPDWLAEHGVTILVASASLFRHFVRTLDGRRLTGIRLVRLGSEPVFAADFEAYRGHFSEACLFVNTFSSSETGNIAQHVLHADDEPEPGRLPVGRPVAGMEVLLEDGEIAVRSDYISPGYWREEALTSQRFGERMFRTGDLGEISRDGVLTVLGRKDRQAKVRGSRVDLLEVESALAARPAVAAAAVSPRLTPRGDTALTAHVALRPGAHPDAAELREGLRATLPDHAVPTSFAFLDAVPLNAHGKVDREALALIEPETAVEPARPAFAISETEELLAEIWAGAMERESVSPEDDFFALEGDSLTAAEIAAAVHDRLGVEIELDAFASSPTVAAMAQLIDSLRAGGEGSARSPLTSVSRDEPIPCSHVQERTWRQCETGSGSYTSMRGVRIRGDLDVARLRSCLDRLVGRHEALRTTFEERDGKPVQIVHPRAPIELPVVEVGRAAQADELALREAQVPFDLERGPLVRFLLLRLAGDEHRLLRMSHHIIFDGHSWDVFFEELAALYDADARGAQPPFSGEAPIQYADFAAWERRTLKPGTPLWRKDVEWWRSNLEGAPPQTTLPFARAYPDKRAAVADGVLYLKLPPATSDALDSLRREEGATHFMVRLAAFAALLAVMGGNADMVIGSYSTTRRLVETRDTFGFFTNPVALRLRFEGNPSFRAWLAQVRTAVIEASAHAQTPYDAVCDELRATGTIPPEFHSIFSIVNEMPPARFQGLEMTPIDRAYASMPWGFTLAHRRDVNVERCLAAFDARLYDPKAVRSFVKRYRRLFKRICAEPDRPLGELVRGRSIRFSLPLRRGLSG